VRAAGRWAVRARAASTADGAANLGQPAGQRNCEPQAAEPPWPWSIMHVAFHHLQSTNGRPMAARFAPAPFSAGCSERRCSQQRPQHHGDRDRPGQ